MGAGSAGNPAWFVACLSVAVACGSDDDENQGGTAARGGAAGKASGGVGATGGASTGGAGAAGGAGGFAGGAGTDAGMPDASNEGDASPAGPRSIYVVPATLDALADDSFFDHPWPSDVRREQDGSARFEGYPNPRPNALLDVFLAGVDGLLQGFSPVAAGFMRFDAPIDEASLPATPLAAKTSQSSVQLIDIDPLSSELGQRQLVSLYARNPPGVYWRENTLSFMPTLGFPLRRNTRYALVVTDDLRAGSGDRFSAAADLRQVLALDPASGPSVTAQAALASAVTAIETAGIPRARIVHLAVFTTDDPVGETIAVRDATLADFPAPDVVAGSWTATDVTTSLDVYEGTYGPSPDYQEGTVPFVNAGDGGAFVFDASNNPIVQRTLSLRFALAVPNAAACPLPAGGYPIALYGHGTGGNYRSMLGATREAQALATRCIATLSTDQIFHGARPGAGVSSPDLLVFNILNPDAARTTIRQSAIDLVQQARLFSETGISVPANISRTGSEIRFDGSRLLFFGHSQGGLNGPLFLAVDNQTRGAALSGSASMLSVTLLEKTQPIDVPTLLKQQILGLTPAEYEEVNLFHPWISLAQSLVDQSDPIHYVRHIAREPRPGFAAKSVIMTEGVTANGSGDSYSPPHGIEVQAIALGLPPQEPLIHSPAELAWGGAQPVTVPAGGLSGNLAGGAASGVLAQWLPTGGDGHFVIYQIPAAMAQAAGALQNLALDPLGRVPPP